MLLRTAVKSEGCILSYTSYPPFGWTIASDSQLQRTPAKLICNLQKEKKNQGRGGSKGGAPKDCKIVQHESSDSCCFQSAVCQLEAQGVCARERKDNAEK